MRTFESRFVLNMMWECLKVRIWKDAVMEQCALEVLSNPGGEMRRWDERKGEARTLAASTRGLHEWPKGVKSAITLCMMIAKRSDVAQACNRKRQDRSHIGRGGRPTLLVKRIEGTKVRSSNLE